MPKSIWQYRRMGPTWDSSEVWHLAESEDKIPAEAIDRRRVDDGQLWRSYLTEDGKARVEVRVNLSQSGESVLSHGALPEFFARDGLNMVLRVVPVNVG